MIIPFIFLNTIHSQEGTTIFEEDSVPYEKVEITDRKQSIISLSGSGIKDNTGTKSISNAKSSGSGIGETPGNLSVSLTGGLNYDIPIAVPPGIDGIVPEIALSYNSQGGNGIAGYGWNIDGISAITRIPSSKYHDNYIDKVDFDTYDRFAFDGERLILKSGSYNSINGAIFETEKYSNLKIIAHGSSPYGNGPEHFVVYFPDGSTARYGDSTDSRSLTTYAITYWENPQGVRINYEYILSSNSQSISTIKYGSIGENSPINEIRFNYTGRERREQSYVNDVSVIGHRLVRSIEAYSNGVRYRKYDLLFDKTVLKYERLSTVTEYSGDGTESHSSIDFTYQDSGSSIVANEAAANLGLSPIHQENAEVAALDMTGNGKMDVIVYPNEKDKFWTIHDIQNQTTNYAYEYDTGDFEAIFPTTLLNHENKVLAGQGLTMVQNGSGNQINFKVFGKSGAGTSAPITTHYTKVWNAPVYNPSSPTNIPMDYVSGDFNGDGLTDILALGKPHAGSTNYKKVYFVNLRRDISSGFINLTGELQLKLSGSYKFHTGDFNGDGKTDIMHIIDGKVYVYTLSNTNTLDLLWITEDTGIKVKQPFLIGDYNGDGKTDFMEPVSRNNDDFNVFISTGTRFENDVHDMPFTYRTSLWYPESNFFYGYNLIPIDANGDGKTDIVEYNTVTRNGTTEGTQNIKVYNNLRINHANIPTRLLFQSGGEATRTGNLSHFPIPIFLNSNQQNKNLEFASISNQWITNFSFTNDHRDDVMLSRVDNNGVSYEIGYSNIDPDIANEEYDAPVYLQSLKQVYSSNLDQIYPNIDLNIALSAQVVNYIRRHAHLSSGTEITKKVYAYKGAVFNAEGEGFLGFSAIARSNWHTDSDDRVFSISKYDPNLKGAMIEQYSMPNYHNFTTPTSNYISKTIYNYSSSLSSSKVLKVWLNSSFNQNYLNGTFTNRTYQQYDQYYNPENIVTTFNGGSKHQVIQYSNNTSSNYHIGRITNIVTTSTLGGNSFSTEEDLSYTGYLLTQRKIKGHNTPFNIETYEHDTFGNIIKTTTTPNGSPSREVEFDYDPTGRFITKAIDIEDFETSYTYNPEYGDWNISKITNHFGHEIAYYYDSWDRPIRVTDYLGNDSFTDYTEVDNAYTVTDSSDDGSEMITEYDQLQRISVVKEKNVLGDWINVKYEYDILGRLAKESEPYSQGNPTLWNETAYDIYGRPISQTLATGRIINIDYNNLTTIVNDGVKTVETTRDGAGNVTEVRDPGGTIRYSYYGNGSMRRTYYNDITITSEQDGWGRQTALVDPSAGTYEYDYNGYGEITREVTPKGRTSYEYSSTGRLLNKVVEGDNIEMHIRYSYDPSDKLLNAISLTSSDGNNSDYNYQYDNYKRLVELSETNPYARFSTRYDYDSFGRVESERSNAQLSLNEKSTDVAFGYTYDNGQLKSIRHENGIIWEVNEMNHRGQITKANMGNGIRAQNTYNAYGFVEGSTVLKNVNTSPVEMMKLTTNFNSQRGTLESRSNNMFSWSEEFEYDNLDRLISFSDNAGDNAREYDDLGRPTFDSAIGDFNYTGSSYQVNTADLNAQGDLYYQQNRLQQITFNAFKKPSSIKEMGKENIDFLYNAFMGRSHMFYGNEAEDIRERVKFKHYSHDGSMEISYDKTTDTTRFVTYIGGDAYTAPAIWRSEQGREETTEGFYYLHRDYLGSIMLITDADGEAMEKRHFDAWGNITRLADGDGRSIDQLTFLDRGYTGHEHLQGVGLIHMNGRLYDSKLRRFLSPDNHIQNPYNTQNFNRYSYVLNNPLMYTDPSGEIFEPNTFAIAAAAMGVWSLGNLISDNWDGIDGWLTDNVFRPIQKIQPGKWIEGWFKKRSKKPVEYSNYEGLSSDPLAGSSANMPNTFFNAGGSESSLGIGQAFSKTIKGFGRGFINKFAEAGKGLVNLVTNPIDTISKAASHHWYNISDPQRFLNYMADNPWVTMGNPILQQYSYQRDIRLSLQSNDPFTTLGQIKGDRFGGAVIDAGSIYGLKALNLGARNLNLPNFKALKKNGRVNGLSVSRGPGYGARPRLDFHPLMHPSSSSKWLSLPKWLRNGIIPILHYHRRGRGGIKRHRPWEGSPGDTSWWQRF